MCFAVNAYKRKICIISREKQKREEHKYLLLENITDETYGMFGKKREDNESTKDTSCLLVRSHLFNPQCWKGVFCKVDVPVGVVYGPYEGILRKDQKQAECDGYSWEIKYDSETVFIDGRDPRYSNWMRFINSSRFESEQNLLAFQYGGSVYYRVFRPIDREKELLVWYGDSYGKALGVNTTPAKALKSTVNPLKRKKSKSLAKNLLYFESVLVEKLII
uniref:SET domain-containing protein n=1 Tax=Ditylenchus dipsaci TaxID=166011 RepID=A0A915D740_9BILA